MSSTDSLFDLSFTDNRGNKVDFNQFRGKPVLIVNTASKCGFTPQYEGLQKLYEEFRDEGLVVVGFPSDQFAHQEPGSDSEIDEFCKINFGVTFPLSTKIDVNGKNTHPVFSFLRRKARGLVSNRIKWNFTKFLVYPDGQKVQRFSPTTKPEELRNDVLAALGKS